MADASQLGQGPTGPLQGVRILDMTSVVFGAYATQMLGDLGADIIKLESPGPNGVGGGDVTRYTGMPPKDAPDMGALFMSINRNKRSLLLDLKNGRARRFLDKILRRVDVVASSIRYDGMTRLGLSYEDVRKINPQIVFVHACGYGSEGPYAGRPAYDDLIQAESGFADLLPRTDGNPAMRYLPTIVADKVGGLFMSQAILAALFHKQKTGEGQFVEVPMLESATSFLLTEHFFGHIFDPPTDTWTNNRVTNPFRRPFASKDGYVAIMPYSDGQWTGFFNAIGKLDRLTEDARFNSHSSRYAHIGDLYALIEEFTRSRTTDEWIELLMPLNIPVSRVNRIEDLQDHPHLKAVGLFEKHQHQTAGSYYNVRSPLRFSKTPPNIRRHPPRLGEHTEEILAEYEADMSEMEKKP